jgi:hypothetical protein
MIFLHGQRAILKRKRSKRKKEIKEKLFPAKPRRTIMHASSREEEDSETNQMIR